MVTVHRPSSHRRGTLLAWALVALCVTPAVARGGPGKPAPKADAGSVFPDQRRAAARDRLALGLRFRIQEQLPAADQAFRLSLAASGGDPAAQRAYGDHALFQGDLNTAGAAYAAITRLDPYGADGYALLGMVEAMRQRPEAAGHLAKALEMDRRGAGARLAVAWLARAAGDVRRMELALADLAPGEGEGKLVALEQATLALRRADVAGAVKRLDTWVAGDPGRGERQLRAGEHLLAHGQCGPATRRLRREVSERPRAEAFRSFGWALLLCGHEPIRAAGAFQAALNKDPNDDGAKVGLAWALLGLRREPEALVLAAGTLDELLGRSPDQASALLARAEVHRRQGDLDGAGALLARVPAEHPARAEADSLLARLAVDREDPYAAVRSVRELMKRRPDSVHLRFNLALAYVRAGRSGEARRTLDEGLELLPKHHPLRVHGQRILGTIKGR